MSRLEYRVDYEKIDPFKIEAQRQAATTDFNSVRLGPIAVPASRGESGFAVELDDRFLVFAVEGLGTKNRIADQMRADSGGTKYYAGIAKCLLATCANDVLTLGAEVVVVGTIVDAGSSEWFEDQPRYQAFCQGFADACNEIGAVWGPGESAHLAGLVASQRATLNCACIAQVMPKENFTLKRMISPGNRILLLPSSGIHANYLTACYDLSQNLARGLDTPINDEQSFGEALLAPTTLYQQSIMDLFAAGIYPTYMVNITGHGWRKLMRSATEVGYVVDTLPKVPLICKFVQERGHLSDYDAYQYMNMGAGFAVIVAAGDAEKALEILRSNHASTIDAGYVTASRRRVIIEPLGVRYDAKRLMLR